METWITELTPLSFLERSAAVHPEKVAVVYGAGPAGPTASSPQRRARSWPTPCAPPASAPVTGWPTCCRTSAEMLVAHFAVPLAGAVLVAINTRLSAEEVRYICDHSGSVAPGGRRGVRPRRAAWPGALETVRDDRHRRRPGRRAAPTADPGRSPTPTSCPSRRPLTTLPWAVDDERATISINYTSGTTGRPKGVMYTHRGAYLNALGEVLPLGASRTTASTCGRCRCSTATAGARPWAARRGRRHPGLPARRCAATRSGS